MALPVLYMMLFFASCLWIYLWRSSHAFRYYMKLTYYYIDIQVAALATLFPALLHPCDARNIRYFQNFAWFTFKILRIKIEKRNTAEIENLAEPAILVLNHQHTLDVIGLMEITPYRATFLAKKALMYAGYFGLSSALSGLIFIDRLNPEKAIGTMRKVVKIMHDKQIKIWVFPEGTRNLNGQMLPFKKGAFHLAVQAQVPIYPLVLSSYQHFLDPKKKIFNTGKVIASGLPRIETKGLTEADVSDLTLHVHDVMEQEFHKITREVQTEARSMGCSILAE